MRLRLARPGDGMEITAIHAEGLATGHASFRDVPWIWDDWAAAHDPALVAERGGIVVGWAGLQPISSRPCYAGVGEVSVYVGAAAQGGGVGRALLSELVAVSERAGWWTLQAHLFPENAASLRLHRACGFREVGRRARLGRMDYGPMAGRWRDVLLLERRATVAG